MRYVKLSKSCEKDKYDQESEETLYTCNKVFYTLLVAEDTWWRNDLKLCWRNDQVEKQIYLIYISDIHVYRNKFTFLI